MVAAHRDPAHFSRDQVSLRGRVWGRGTVADSAINAVSLIGTSSSIRGDISDKVPIGSYFYDDSFDASRHLVAPSMSSRDIHARIIDD